MSNNWNEKDLQEFVHTHLPQIYNLCLKLSRHPQDAEDLCQEVFIRAIKGLAQFKGDSALSSWIYRIAVNTWKNRVRYEKRRFFRAHVSLSGQATDGEEKADLELADPSPLPEETAEASDVRGKMMKALDRLDDNERSVIVLKDIENKSYEEIAEILEINLGTVKSRLSRARNELREVLLKMEGVTRR